MSRIKEKKRCDFKFCDKIRGVISLTIFEQSPYKSWGTIHICPEHIVKFEEVLEQLLKATKRLK